MLVGLEGHGMRNMISSILKGIGIALGVILLALGGFMGIENVQAPGTINIPIFIFSVAAILVGSIMLWLVFKKKENT
jgi:membrane protein DedA with SNARE-associated domain